MGYKLVFTKRAENDARKLEQAGLEKKAIDLLKIIKNNPYQTPPPYEKLSGDLKGMYSRRINIQHRLIYAVFSNSTNQKDSNGVLYEGIVKVLKMWTHYE
ncbi:MAG: YoeB toxin protein [Firmicutes bacterium]|nr:YoeB toxin protein [Bacillota bacterium]MDI6706704.1 Txe/YoeB family addiction module toxin [Bacillota bacterium]